MDDSRYTAVLVIGTDDQPEPAFLRADGLWESDSPSIRLYLNTSYSSKRWEGGPSLAHPTHAQAIAANEGIPNSFLSLLNLDTPNNIPEGIVF